MRLIQRKQTRAEDETYEPQPRQIGGKPQQNEISTMLWQNKVLPAFWSIGAALSVMLNVALIVIILALGRQVAFLRSLVTDDLLGGLYYNFILMDQATITTTIEVVDTIPVQFDLPLNQNTNVRLTQDTPIDSAQVSMWTGGLNIVDAPTDIVLPEGTVLPVRLDLTVPVDTQIPIHLTVPVEIPLNQTELHQPFVGLQDVVSPYYWLLVHLPDTWQEFLCQFAGICR